MNRLLGKKALVIGAATGIGREVSRLFSLEGADVAVGDVPSHAEELRDLVTDLRRTGGVAQPIEVDVREEDSVRCAVDFTVRQYGRIDVLVNNAGIGGYRGLVSEQTLEQWDQLFDVNLRGVFFGMKYALPYMMQQGYGRIVSTASQLAHKPAPLAAAYSATKAGIVAVSASVAQDVAGYGVTVNIVCPGPTDTPMWRQPGNEEIKRKRIEALPMRRVAQPQEIAWAYVFLASDESSYFTGQSLSPNGGDVMW